MNKNSVSQIHNHSSRAIDGTQKKMANHNGKQLVNGIAGDTGLIMTTILYAIFFYYVGAYELRVTLLFGQNENRKVAEGHSIIN